MITIHTLSALRLTHTLASLCNAYLADMQFIKYYSVLLLNMSKVVAKVYPTGILVCCRSFGVTFAW